MDLKSRINAEIRASGHTKTSFATHSGIARSTLQSILDTSRDVSPSVDLVRKIAVSLDVSMDYLVGISEKSEKIDEPRPDDVDISQIPYYGNVPVSAGGGSTGIQEKPTDTFVIDTEWIKLNIGNPIDVMAFPVIGDSMAPTLKPNDILLCLKNNRITGDGIYIIRLDDAVMVKRLSLQPKGIIKVSSDNANHSAFEIDSTEDNLNFAVIASVKTYIRNT